MPLLLLLLLMVRDSKIGQDWCSHITVLIFLRTCSTVECVWQGKAGSDHWNGATETDGRLGLFLLSIFLSSLKSYLLFLFLLLLILLISIHFILFSFFTCSLLFLSLLPFSFLPPDLTSSSLSYLLAWFLLLSPPLFFSLSPLSSSSRLQFFRPSWDVLHFSALQAWLSLLPSLHDGDVPRCNYSSQVITWRRKCQYFISCSSFQECCLTIIINVCVLGCSIFPLHQRVPFSKGPVVLSDSSFSCLRYVH